MTKPYVWKNRSWPRRLQPFLRHSRAGGNPNFTTHWSPAFAGMMAGILLQFGTSVIFSLMDAPLLVMEAMKMEHTIRAPADGTVTEFFYQAGDLVDGGAELLAFTADQD